MSTAQEDGAGPAGKPAPGVAPGEDADEPAATPADLLSTFALDVDTASYGYARRTLEDGRLPEPATVRPEEFVNSFRQDYPEPAGDGFSVTLDGARTDADGWSLLRVGLATRAADDEDRPPAALTYIVDVSGSMAEPGRLDLVKQSLGLTVDALRPSDSMSVVTFSDEAKVVLPMTPLGSEGARDRIQGVVDELRTDASTNLGAGVSTGYDEAVRGFRAGATNRVVLLSDALANNGDTRAETILERVATAREENGITLFGVGVGSEYGDQLMERLADKGDGHTSYVSDLEEAREVFVEQLPRNVDLRARDAKAQVSFDPEVVEEFRLIGFDNRAVADDDFRDDSVDGGEIGPGHTVTAMYAVRTKEGATGTAATATVRWLDPKSRAAREAKGTVRAGALDGALWGEASQRLQVDAVAAYFADALRGGAEESGALPGTPDFPGLVRRADTLATSTKDPAVKSLADSIRLAGNLGG